MKRTHVLTIALLLIMVVFITACTSGETYTVTFIDYDDTVITTKTLAEGEEVTPPEAPTREGYTFTEWRGNLENIVKDTNVYAEYTIDDIGLIGEKINELHDAQSYTEVLNYTVEDEHIQTNTFLLDENGVYTKYERPDEIPQEAYFMREEEAYSEHVVYQQASCFETSELDQQNFTYAQENFSWRRFIPSGVTIEWFDEDDGVYTLRDNFYNQVVTLIGTDFEYYAIQIEEDTINFTLELVNDNEKTVRYEIVFSALDATEVTLPILDYCVAESSEDFSYYETDDGLIITEYTGEDTEIVIPSELDGMPVKEIGFDAFYQTYNITDIVIEEGIERIGPWAFAEMPSLQTIYIPSTVNIIDEYAFQTSNALSIHAQALEEPSGWHNNYKPEDTAIIWDYDNHSPEEEDSEE